MDTLRRVVAAVFVAFTVAGCGGHVEPDAIGSAGQALEPTVTLTASPNPCVAGTAASCTTQVQWTSSYSTPKTQIWISRNDGAPTLVVCGNSSGTASASIGVGVVARFSLHPSTDCTATNRGVEAASTIARGYRAHIEASPNPCSAAVNTACNPTVSWSSGYTSANHQVWVSQNGGPMSYFSACGAQGSSPAPWIVPGNTYVFTLHQATSCDASARGAQVDSTTVRGLADHVAKNGTRLELAGQPLKTLGMNKHELVEMYLGI